MLFDPLQMPHFVHSAPPYAGAPPAGTHQAVVWSEQLPLANAPVRGGRPVEPKIRHQRLWIANYANGVNVAQVDRNGVAQFPPARAYATTAESASAGLLFFLSDHESGGAGLYSAPLNPAAGTVQATLVMDRVFGFWLREDKSRLLVERADGTLFSAQLAPGKDVAGLLQPIATHGPAGDVDYSGLNARTFGFTPDGDHAFVVVNQQSTTAQSVYRGQLLTVDLATGARTNWGRITWASSATHVAGFLANTSVAVFLDTLADGVEARAVVAKASTPMAHADTGAYQAGNPTDEFIALTSVDGSELLARMDTFAVAVQKDGSFHAVPVTDRELQIAATNSVFGAPACFGWLPCYLPEASRVDYTVGDTFSAWKIWGGTTAAPFVTVARGGAIAPSGQSVILPGYTEIEYGFTAAGDPGSVMFLPLTGKEPPRPLTP
jgi:hypothetical protein